MTDATTNARSLRDVASELEGVALDAARDGDRKGYFAALYVHVARRFADELDAGVFEHPELMQKLDVTFFDRYLAALRCCRNHEPVSGPWQVAFEAAEKSRYAVLQQLMLGMNAHILFDLGIAVADAIPRDELPALKRDFMTMNALLESLLGTVLRDMGDIFAPYRWFQCLFGNIEEQVIMFGMRGARDYAWSLAGSLAAASPTERTLIVARASRIAEGVARATCSPPFPIGTALRAIALLEVHTPARVIEILLSDGERLLGMRPRGRSGRAAVPKKRKVAVLGGGVGAMTAAFRLTDPKNPRAKDLDVTVYQMGFRLGGKGASGRGAHGRIQEHGLHVWSGMYDNAFAMMRDAYAELGRPPSAPLATFDDAFKKHSLVVLMEKVGEHYEPWTLQPPENSREPGTGGLFPSLFDYLIEAIDAAHEMLSDSPHAGRLDAKNTAQLSAPAQLALEHGAQAEPHTSRGLQLLGAARIAAERLRPGGARSGAKLGERSISEFVANAHADLETSHIEELLEASLRSLWAITKDEHGADTDLRRLWILLNFGFANAIGILRDRVWLRGFDCINGQDYAAWMAKYAIDDGGLMLRSPMVTGQYDGCFAFPGAALGRASMEAGIGLRVNVRAFFTYKGAVMYKMQAGMGDTVFGPLYEVLERRGVRFEFFHRVRELVPNADGTQVESIELDVQAKLNAAQTRRGGYSPLVPVLGLPCFPAHPDFEQLEDGQAMAEAGADFESYDDTWPAAAKKVLTRGADFDDVLCGISLGALPYVAGRLIEQTPSLKLAVDNVQTIATQAYQLWLNRDSAALGWKGGGEPITSCLDYGETNAIDTWGDMTFLAAREDWPKGDRPKSIAYLCAAVDDAVPLVPTPHGPKQAASAFDQKAANDSLLPLLRAFLEGPASWYFPRVAGNGAFDWSALVAPGAPRDANPARLATQWIRRNVQPSERYVLSVAGSDQYRFPVHDETAYQNLVFAGDFTKCTLNVGCVEAAAISGCLASNALTGFPALADIVGLDF